MDLILALGGSHMPHPSILAIRGTVDSHATAALNIESFEGWWSPVDRLLLGGFNVFDINVVIIHTLPWDGAMRGRTEMIIQSTKENRLVTPIA